MTWEFTQWLAALLRAGAMTPPASLAAVQGVQRFEDVGIFSSSDGLVVQLRNGDEVQITVVQTAHASRTKYAGVRQ